MVTRARVVRAYYELRECADAAAAMAVETRESIAYVTSPQRAMELAQDAEFHSGRHAGLLTALGILDKVLADDS